VFRIHFETTETNRTVSKQNRKTEKIVEKGVKASKIVFEYDYDMKSPSKENSFDIHHDHIQ
jgi:hypothetical protein